MIVSMHSFEIVWKPLQVCNENINVASVIFMISKPLHVNNVKVNVQLQLPTIDCRGEALNISHDATRGMSEWFIWLTNQATLLMYYFRNIQNFPQPQYQDKSVNEEGLVV